MAEPLSADALARRRAAVGDLGDALRELVDAAVLTEVAEAELAAVAGAVREQAALLRKRARELTGIAAVDDPEVGERWYNPVYGPGNPLAAPLDVVFSDGGRVGARVTLGKPFEGPPGLVHGGFIAAMLDHVLARAARSAGHGGLTATLTVRFRRPVPLGAPLLLEATVSATEGRRTTSRGTVALAEAPDVPLAEGEAVLVSLRAERAAQVFAATGRSVGAWTHKTPGDA